MKKKIINQIFHIPILVNPDHRHHCLDGVGQDVICLLRQRKGSALLCAAIMNAIAALVFVSQIPSMPFDPIDIERGAVPATGSDKLGTATKRAGRPVAERKL